MIVKKKVTLSSTHPLTIFKTLTFQLNKQQSDQLFNTSQEKLNPTLTTINKQNKRPNK